MVGGEGVEALGEALRRHVADGAVAGAPGFDEALVVLQQEREAEAAEIRRRQDEADRKLQKENPWAWKKVKREREAAEALRKEKAEERKREAERRIAVFNRGKAWAMGWETETLEDIADEIVQAEKDPRWLSTFAGPQTILDIRRIWINRIKTARLRALGVSSGK